ncbi:lipase 3-like [Linepithema humile]|uniref:lipase 3-like n=1 Tax=Linepithema humile TaxID=83485 RepID=UPI000623057D|nr:PREDICTED: lipase 3-like [Linepithema humile]
MILDMKSVLFAYCVITIFAEGESQFWQGTSFPQNDLINFLFPKDPNLVKVRKIEQTSGSEAVVLDFIGLVEQYGYPAEEHNVTTEDGYNLKIHRIPGSPLLNNKKKKKVVFVQHGIFASSDSWVLFGPGKDLVFLLADQGYDVWIGNIRGNTYCRSHIEWTTYDRKFWQFSFHEIGTKDLPVMIDYALNYTKQKSLLYIGYSMGTTTLFVLLSMKPEYNEKINMAICLAPVVSWIKITPTMQEIVNITPALKEFLDKYEIYDLFPQSLTTITAGKILCNDEAMTQAICTTVIFLLVGSDPAQLNTTALPHLISYFPAGASVQTLHHYYQNIVSNKFRAYDYGVISNYEQYGQKMPPNYDLKKSIAPIFLFYSVNDMIVTKENVFDLSKRLPNVVLTEEIPFKLFNHADYQWALNAKTLLYDRVLEVMQEFHQNVTMK